MSLRVSNVLGELAVIEFFCIETFPLAVNPEAHPRDVESALSTVPGMSHESVTVISSIGYRSVPLACPFSTVVRESVDSCH